MTIFVESPWPWLLIGIGVETALAVALLRTQRGAVLWAMLAVAALWRRACWSSGWWSPTGRPWRTRWTPPWPPSKPTTSTGCWAAFLPRPKASAAMARLVLDRVEVRSVWIRDLEIKVNRLTSPWTAKARFLAIGNGRDRKNEFPYDTFSRRVVVKFRREGDRWLVTGYDVEDFDPPRP